jgi:tetratricopeptide (TPR) repeat protein
LLAEILYNLGTILTETGERQQGEAYLQEGLQIQRAQGNRGAEQRTLIYLSRSRVEDRDYQAGRSYLMEAMSLLQLTGNRPAESRIVNLLGYVEAMLGNYGVALDCHTASRRISQEIQQPVQESHALHNLCTVQRKMGNLPLAEAYGQEALRLAVAHDLPDAASYARLHLGYVWLACGDLPEARSAFQLAADDWQRQQHTTLMREATVGLAAVAYQEGNLAHAAALITPVVPILIERIPASTDEPFEMYLTCYQVLTTLRDPRASDLLATAYSQLQTLASKITDGPLRQSFWRASAHCKIRAYMYAKRNNSTPP